MGALSRTDPAGCRVCGAPHRGAPRSASSARVAVVVCHYRQPRQLARTLDALARQTRPPDEVVVADDGSPEPPRVPPGVGVVRQDDRGFRAARARNLGAAATTADLLVFLDADTSPEPDFLARLTAPLRAEPDLLVVGHRRHARFAADDPAVRVEELPEPAWLADGWRATRDLRDADEGSFRYVISSVLAGHRWWFDRVGGFDAGLVGYGGEDWDLAHRWWTAGGRLRHVPDAVAWHDGPDAGARPPGPDPDDDPHDDPDAGPRTREALAVARRVTAPVTAFAGVRAGPARVVVEVDPGLGLRAQVIAVDGLLRDQPLAVVASDHPWWAGSGDDRVVPTTSSRWTTAAARALLRVRLHRGVAARPGAWTRLLHTVPPRVHRELGVEALAVATVTDLRRLRRCHLALEAETTDQVSGRPGLRDAAGIDLDAWLGDWWDDGRT